VTQIFSGADLWTLTELVCGAWQSAADRDWTAPAGTLDWSCAETADHAVDTVFAPAFFLASRKLDGYLDPWGPLTMGANATPENLVGGLRTASRTLIAVVAAALAEPDARAAIWQWPRVETRPPVDFVPRGALELILHAHDVCLGLGVAFEPPADLCERLRDHTREWPMWELWDGLPATDDPWDDLLAGSGRTRAPS
jgi:hypothetical protein